MMLMAYLEGRLTTGALVDLLQRAGETRRIEELKDMGSWSTFDQFKRLLEESARLLGLEFLVNGTFLSSSSIENFDMAENLQAFGSPGELLRAGGGTNPLMPMRRYEMTEVGPTEWTIRESWIRISAPGPRMGSQGVVFDRRSALDLRRNQLHAMHSPRQPSSWCNSEIVSDI